MRTTHTIRRRAARHRAARSRSEYRRPEAILLILCILTPLFAVVACGGDESPTEPRGGYLAFREALLGGDPHQVWEWISEDTKQIYRDAVQDIQALAESVEMLSPADRSITYERTAVRLAEFVESGEDLFAEVIRLENLVGDQRYELGTDIDDLVTTDDEHATVTTESEQVFELVREEDGLWRVSSLSELARLQVRPIAESVTAVDIIAAESAYMRRSHEEIVRLLGGTVEADGDSPEESDDEDE